METTLCPSVDEWIQIMWYTSFHIVKYYLAMRKKGNPVICDNMDEPGVHYASETDQIQNNTV